MSDPMCAESGCLNRSWTLCGRCGGAACRPHAVPDKGETEEGFICQSCSRADPPAPDRVRTAREFLRFMGALSFDVSESRDDDLISLVNAGYALAEDVIAEHEQTGGAEPGAEGCGHEARCGFCRARAAQLADLRAEVRRLRRHPFRRP